MLRMYQVITFGPFTGPGGSDVQGYLAVEGNANISHYSVSDQKPAPSGSELYTYGVIACYSLYSFARAHFVSMLAAGRNKNDTE